MGHVERPTENEVFDKLRQTFNRDWIMRMHVKKTHELINKYTVVLKDKVKI